MNNACMRKECGDIGCHKMTGGFYCNKHYRFFYMIHAARKSKKDVPSFNELEILLYFCTKNMECRSCGTLMKWHSKYDNNHRSKVISLQHNNIGTMFLICQGCNAAHGKSTLKDDYFNLPKNHKYCKLCKRILPFSRFHRLLMSRDGHKAYCKSCRSQQHKNKSKKIKNQSSFYHGVYKRKNVRIKSQYAVSIKLYGNTKHIGSFITEENAAIAHDIFIIDHQLVNKKLNFPVDFYD